MYLLRSVVKELPRLLLGKGMKNRIKLSPLSSGKLLKS